HSGTGRTGDTRWQAAALKAGWDLLILDEAHHLCDPGAENAMVLATAFAARVPGLLLLTATPDTGGTAMLFWLLQLLDPHRFHDPEAFRAAQADWVELARMLEALLDGDASAPLPALPPPFAADAELRELFARLAHTEDEEERRALRAQVVRALLDRHGTGRVMFRNTRRHVGGFPLRQLHAVSLQPPADFCGATALYPAEAWPDAALWLREDPRVAWVAQLLQQHRDRKFLLICHERRSAEALENWLRLQRGVRSAVFHEGLRLLERDRAAAWFAETEGGAQVLVCSEIGSEGRNFQFAQDLILFDLPADPDLVEQRIGRLDRIGQADTIRIHVPCLEGSSQA